MLESALIASILLGSGFAQAASGASLDRYDELDSAAGVLMVVVDGKSFCGLKADEASTLLLVTHSKLDQEREAIAKKPGIARGLFASGCMKACHCGAWADLADQLLKAEAAAKTAGQLKSLAAELRKKAEKTGPRDERACAAKFAPKFCQSPLLRQLRHESPEFSLPN